MNAKVLLLRMTGRLYDDIKFVTEQNPTQIVDDEGARAYNALLAKARKYFPIDEFLNDFPEWQGRTIKYKDALVVVGQLNAMVSALMEDEFPPRQPSRRPSTRQRTPVSVERDDPQFYQDVAEESELDMAGDFDDLDKPPDEELYGPGPVVRNEDGTIPFSLD